MDKMARAAKAFDRFTRSAQPALSVAQREAERLQASEIEPEHLLLGLIADSGNSAVGVLRASDVKRESVRAAIEAVIQQGEQDKQGATEGGPALSARTKQAILLAVAEVRRMRGLIFFGTFYVLSLLISLKLSSDSSSSIDTLQLFLLPIVFVTLLVFSLLSWRYYRYQEYQADEFALQTTGKVQAFKNAMTRLTNMNGLVATSTWRARHPPSHPTLLKRLKHADEFAARQTTSGVSAGV